MVTGNAARKFEEYKKEEKDFSYLPDPLKYTSVSLTEIMSNHTRLEASAFSLDAKLEKEKLLKCTSEVVELWSDKGFVKDCYYGGRAKRNYVPRNVDGAVGFLGSSEMLEINPKPVKFLPSKKINVSQFRVKKGSVLISRSGTIGNVAYVSDTLEKHLVSEHAIRIVPNKFGGYIYAYLKTRTGKTLVQANTFGAVVDQVEPEHFRRVLIPNPSDHIKSDVHNLIEDSFSLRDQSNALMNQAEELLYIELHLPKIIDLKADYFSSQKDIRNFSTKLSDLNLRFDSSYHLPSFNSIYKHLKQKAKTIKVLRDNSLTNTIILPGRFKRTYVDSEEFGIKFIGGKQIKELNPISDKFLSNEIHGSRLGDELLLHENCILITRSGTIGKVAIVPKHWESWAANEHIIRLFPVNESIAGFLFCWLNSDYGTELIQKHTYGAVVDEIDTNHVGDIVIPLLKNESKQKEINDLVLTANKLRYEAHLKEQEAIKMVEDVINTRKPLSVK